MMNSITYAYDVANWLLPTVTVVLYVVAIACGVKWLLRRR